MSPKAPGIEQPVTSSSQLNPRKKKRAPRGNKHSLPADTCKRKRIQGTKDDSDDEDYKPPPWVKIPDYSTMKASTALFFPQK
jgi:hypothetical protein